MPLCRSQLTLSHCAWTYNCVGLGNHQPFIIFLVLLVCGVPLTVYSTHICKDGDLEALADFPDLSQLESSQSKCFIIGEGLCHIVCKDPFVLSIMAWACTNWAWAVMLMVTQLYQISQALSTNETINMRRYGYPGGGPVRIDRPEDPCSRHSRTGGFARFSRFFGVDVFAATFLRRSAARGNRFVNPFDRHSVLGNCQDFWSGMFSSSSPLALHVNAQDMYRGWLFGREVDYSRLYTVPQQV